MISRKKSFSAKLLAGLNNLFSSGDKKKPDYTFLVFLGLILVLGLVFLSSASSVVSYDQYGDAYYLLKQQIFKGLVFGLILFFLVSHIPYYKWKRLSLPLLLTAIFLVLLVFVPHVGVNYLGGRRWLRLPGFTFQPTEILKLALIVYLAAWFDSRQKKIKSFRQVYLPFIGVLVVIGLLVMKEPDLGTTVLLLAIAMTIYFVAGGHLGLIIGSGFVSLGLVWWLIILASYRLDRFIIFLHPELDPQGIGYHINQAFLAIGSGGLFGRGFGHSRQKFNYLPEVESDSIFAIIAEEMGFVFTILFLSLLAGLFYRGLVIARRAPDIFGKLLVVGIMSWVIWQSLLNIMAMIGLVPLTGVPLPFVSYGSSSLVILLAAMGIVVNVSKYAK